MLAESLYTGLTRMAVGYSGQSKAISLYVRQVKHQQRPTHFSTINQLHKLML